MPAINSAPPSPPAATHTGTMSRGVGGGGIFSGDRRVFGQDRPVGYIPRQCRDRVDDSIADLVVHSPQRVPWRCESTG